MSLSTACHLFSKELSLALAGASCDNHWTPKGRIYLIGNGGSAAVASHIAIDLMKKGFSAITLTDPAVVTCFSNDYSYADVYSAQIERHWTGGGTLVAISSSGQSANIINAVHYAKDARMTVVTLSGFYENNPLRGLGDHNYYVPSHNYGIVEIAHLTILHALVNPGG